MTKIYYTKDQQKQHILMLAIQLTQLEEECKKLKEEMRDVLYTMTKHNIKNVVYKGEKIEIGNGDYDYTLD